MNELNPHLLGADAVVLVSPIYYYAINDQIKAVIDRFYANDKKLLDFGYVEGNRLSPADLFWREYGISKQ